MALNVAPWFLKQFVFVFLLEIYITFLYLVAPPITVLQVDVLLLLIQFVNQHIFLET
jgi:hypothetical protein